MCDFENFILHLKKKRKEIKIFLNYLIKKNLLHIKIIHLSLFEINFFFLNLGIVREITKLMGKSKIVWFLNASENKVSVIVIFGGIRDFLS